MGGKQRGEEKLKTVEKGTYAGCHTETGDTNHVLKGQKCYRAFVVMSSFQQMGNIFSKYGLVSQP